MSQTITGSQGLAVDAIDLRGRGGSDDERFDVEQMSDHVRDVATMAAMVCADERLRQEFAGSRLPLPILHGTHVKATRPSGSPHFHDTPGSRDQTLKRCDGSLHDPPHDLDEPRVMASVTSWIGART